MAFTLDVGRSGTATPISNPAGAGPKLAVAMFAKDTANDPTGVTYGGQAMTRLTETINGAQGAEIWYLIDPPTGTQSLAYTLAGAHRAHIATYNVAAGQAVEFDGENGASGTSTGPSVAITPTAQPNVIVAVCAHEGASAMTAKGAGQVSASDDADGFVDEGTWNSAHTYEPTTSTAANTQTFTNGASDTWSMRVAVFREVAGPVIPDWFRPEMSEFVGESHYFWG